MGYLPYQLVQDFFHQQYHYSYTLPCFTFPWAPSTVRKTEAGGPLSVLSPPGSNFEFACPKIMKIPQKSQNIGEFYKFAPENEGFQRSTSHMGIGIIPSERD